MLAPRWGDLGNPWHLAAWSIGGMLLLATLAALYLRELRQVRRSAALVLLLLRLVVLLAVLFLVGFQPVIAHSTTEELPGRVLLAMDRSESMAVADPQRPIVDKLRLARVLHLARDLCPDAQLDGWIRTFEESGKLENLSVGERTIHDQVSGRIDGLTRAQIGGRLLTRDGLRLLDALRSKHQVEMLGFAQNAWEVPENAVGKLLETETAATSTLDSEHSKYPQQRSATDLGLPLARGLELSGPEKGKLLGVVVLTDGQHNSGPSPVPKAQELGEHRVPLFPIALGARLAPPDLALVSVRAPTSVFKDVEAPVEARIKISGLPAQDVVVELQRPNSPPLEERFHHDGSDRSYAVRFNVRLDKPGAQSLQVAVKPLKGEIRTDNNSRPFVINVADDKAKVLLVDGEARWEYHYLASALARDPTIQTESVIFHQPRLGKIPEDELEKIGNPKLTMPPQPDALVGFDCIVLGDVAPDQLPPQERARLEKYVADGGGTLVLVAGKRFMPLTYLDGVLSPQNAIDPLAKLLPIQSAVALHPEKGFTIGLTHDGKLTPLLQLEADSGSSEECWAALPRHFWGMVGKAKPGALALAFAQTEADRTTTPGAQEKEQAVLVRQNYGFGRVLFVGLDSTWRWRHKTGDLYHHRFWGQVVRWAAAEKPLVAGNEHVRFGTREAAYRQGQDVDLVVRLGEQAGRLRPDALAGANIVRTGQGIAEAAVALVPLTPQEGQPRVLQGRIRDLPPGQYSMELVIPDLAGKLEGPRGPDGKPAKLRAGFAVLPLENDEMVELATNWPLLEELAAKSGGKVFTPENAAELVDLLAQKVTRVEHYEELRLWQWWATLAVLLGLLSVEWTVRKAVGLP
jgi:hypothetical protein